MSTISTIIPVYNAELYIEECIKSIINQTYRDLEIILINDGSTDKSAEVCKRYSSIDDRIIYIEQDNQGVVSARNKGLDKATGDYIYFGDSDDWLEVDALQNLYDEIVKYDCDLVVANMSLVENHNKRKLRIFDKAFYTNDKEFITKYQLSCIGYGYNPNPGTKFNLTGLGSMGNKLYKKEIIDTYNMRFDPRSGGIYEDNLFVLHYLEKCKSLSFIEESIYNYRKVEDSNSRGYKKDTLIINENIFNLINEFINNYKINNKDIFDKALYIYVIRGLYRSLGAYFFSVDNSKTLNVRLKELKKLINSEPYRTAVKEVESNKLNPKNHKLVWFGAKLNSSTLIYILFELNNIARKIVR